MTKGYISQIIGPVIDVAFASDIKEEDLPAIHHAMRIARADGRSLVIEVQQHIGENTVRCIAMDSTDGLCRGMEGISEGESITMPVGSQIKGRLMNVTGNEIDGMDALDPKGAQPIHRDPPSLTCWSLM